MCAYGCLCTSEEETRRTLRPDGFLFFKSPSATVGRRVHTLSVGRGRRQTFAKQTFIACNCRRPVGCSHCTPAASAHCSHNTPFEKFCGAFSKATASRRPQSAKSPLLSNSAGKVNSPKAKRKTLAGGFPFCLLIFNLYQIPFSSSVAPSSRHLPHRGRLRLMPHFRQHTQRR